MLAVADFISEAGLACPHENVVDMYHVSWHHDACYHDWYDQDHQTFVT